MAAVTSKSALDGRDGGFYKCEECCKAFNRMASYEAHIRMHAQNEEDLLDLVFSYSGKMHESFSAERRATRSRAPARRARLERKLSLSSPLRERVLVAEKPSPQQNCEDTAVMRIEEQQRDSSEWSEVSSTSAVERGVTPPGQQQTGVSRGTRSSHLGGWWFLLSLHLFFGGRSSFCCYHPISVGVRP